MRCNSTSSNYTRQTCRTLISVCGYRHSLTSCYILKHWSAQRNRKGNPLIEQEQGGNLSDKSCESACGHFLHVMNSWIVEWTRRKHKEKEEQKRDHCNFPGLIINLTSEPSFSISPMVMWICSCGKGLQWLQNALGGPSCLFPLSLQIINNRYCSRSAHKDQRQRPIHDFLLKEPLVHLGRQTFEFHFAFRE